VYVCVCVCVWERDRDRDQMRETCVRVCMCVCVCVCVCVPWWLERFEIPLYEHMYECVTHTPDLSVSHTLAYTHLQNIQGTLPIETLSLFENP